MYRVLSAISLILVLSISLLAQNPITGAISSAQVARGSGTNTIDGSGQRWYFTNSGTMWMGQQSAPPSTSILFYNGGTANKNYEVRFGQPASSTDDPWGYFDLWVHDDASFSYTTGGTPGAHQFSLRGTKIVGDNRLGVFGGVHGTVGFGDGNTGFTLGKGVGVQGEADFSGNITGALGELIGVEGFVTAGNVHTPTGRVTNMAGVVGDIQAMPVSFPVDNAYAFWAKSITSNGNITKRAAIRIEDQPTNAFAIDSGNGKIKSTNLAGSGNAYVCVNSAGELYRSSTACN